eukprot:17869-Heterococcus_DN1.PRE.3
MHATAATALNLHVLELTDTTMLLCMLRCNAVVGAELYLASLSKWPWIARSCYGDATRMFPTTTVLGILRDGAGSDGYECTLFDSVTLLYTVCDQHLCKHTAVCTRGSASSVATQLHLRMHLLCLLVLLTARGADTASDQSTCRLAAVRFRQVAGAGRLKQPSEAPESTAATVKRTSAGCGTERSSCSNSQACTAAVTSSQAHCAAQLVEATYSSCVCGSDVQYTPKHCAHVVTYAYAASCLSQALAVCVANPGMESVLSEIDEAAEPGTKLSVLAKPQFAAKLKKQLASLKFDNVKVQLTTGWLVDREALASVDVVSADTIILLQDRNEYMYILDEEEQELASSDTVSRDSQSLAVITLVQDLLHEAAAKTHNSSELQSEES